MMTLITLNVLIAHKCAHCAGTKHINVHIVQEQKRYMISGSQSWISGRAWINTINHTGTCFCVFCREWARMHPWLWQNLSIGKYVQSMLGLIKKTDVACKLDHLVCALYNFSVFLILSRWAYLKVFYSEDRNQTIFRSMNIREQIFLYALHL